MECVVDRKPGSRKAVFVQEKDAEMWRRLEAYADRNRMPVSGAVLRAVEEFLDRHDDDQP